MTADEWCHVIAESVLFINANFGGEVHETHNRSLLDCSSWLVCWRR